MKAIFRLILWCAVFGALAFSFSHLAPVETQALSDEAACLTLLTGEGAVSITMAEYLPGAVAAEMPVSFGMEALKAQAVAARTYTLRAGRHTDGDICTSSSCCLAYKTDAQLRDFWGDDYDANIQAVKQAVIQTDGQYLTYGGEIIQAVFHASSAGATENSAAVWTALPYLISVESPETADSVPELVSNARFTPEELSEALCISPTGEPETWLGDTKLDSAGRVESAVIGGTVFSGKTLRSTLGLRSTAFTVSFEGGEFVFSVAGFGHGVGMSQYGAKLLAAQGWDYEDILAHYYPGTELVRTQAASASA